MEPKLLLVSLSGYLGAGTPKEEAPGGLSWLSGAVQLLTQRCADSVSGWGPVLHIFRRKVTQCPTHPWDTPPSRLPPWGLGTQFWAWTRASGSLCTVCPESPKHLPERTDTNRMHQSRVCSPRPLGPGGGGISEGVHRTQTRPTPGAARDTLAWRASRPRTPCSADPGALWWEGKSVTQARLSPQNPAPG